MVKNANELVAPATSSGLGVATGELVLNSVRGQAVLIDRLFGNAIAIAVFGIGCFALALGIGQYLQESKDTKKWGALASYGSSTLAHGVCPFLVASYMLDNVQNYGGTLQAVADNYMVYMGIIGLILLCIGAVVIYEVE